MPKHVWKCNYCTNTNTFYNETIIHETQCAFNPDNKYCYTCSNYKSDNFWIYGEGYVCTKKLNIERGEDVGNCEGWDKK